MFHSCYFIYLGQKRVNNWIVGGVLVCSHGNVFHFRAFLRGQQFIGDVLVATVDCLNNDLISAREVALWLIRENGFGLQRQ